MKDLQPDDELAVRTFMQALRHTPVSVTSRLPSGDVLWLKAKLVAQWEAQRRARLPMEAMEPWEMAAAAAAATLLLFWSAPSAFAWFTG
jgi:hypothetical protein